MPVYIVHLSAKEALDAVREGRDRGVHAYAETCPQYLYLTLEDMGRPGFEGAKYVCSPPLRPREHQAELWKGLCSTTCRSCSTDHCPFDFKDQKILGKDDFSAIPNGLPGVEDRYTLLWDGGVATGQITPMRFVELIATAPAKMFGLHPTKGTSPGSDADVVVFDPKKERRPVVDDPPHARRLQHLGGTSRRGLARGRPAARQRARGERRVPRHPWRRPLPRAPAVLLAGRAHVTEQQSEEDTMTTTSSETIARQLIGGEFVVGSGVAEEIYDPATGRVLAVVRHSTASDVDAAVRAAAAAFPAWADTPVPDRAEVMFRYKVLLEDHVEELAALVTAENGKTLAEARGEVRRGIEVVALACGAPDPAARHRARPDRERHR